jgi:hypothetical protein
MWKIEVYRWRVGNGSFGKEQQSSNKKEHFSNFDWTTPEMVGLLQTKLQYWNEFHSQSRCQNQLNNQPLGNALHSEDTERITQQ